MGPKLEYRNRTSGRAPVESIRHQSEGAAMTAGTNDLDLRPGLTYKTIETRFCRFCSDAPGDIRHLSRADRNGFERFFDEQRSNRSTFRPLVNDLAQVS